MAQKFQTRFLVFDTITGLASMNQSKSSEPQPDDAVKSVANEHGSARMECGKPEPFPR